MVNWSSTVRYLNPILLFQLSHYIKVAEELSDRLNDSDMESQEYVTIMSDAVKFKTKGSPLPAKPERPPSPAEAALKGQDTRSSSSSSYVEFLHASDTSNCKPVIRPFYCLYKLTYQHMR